MAKGSECAARSAGGAKSTCGGASRRTASGTHDSGASDATATGAAAQQPSGQEHWCAGAGASAVPVDAAAWCIIAA
jgi:hypothetical protein